LQTLETARFEKEPEGTVRKVFDDATKAELRCPANELVAYARLRSAELGRGAFVGDLTPAARAELRTDADKAAARFPHAVKILAIGARADGTVPAARRAVAADPNYIPAKVALAAALIREGNAPSAVGMLEAIPNLDATSDGFTILARAHFAVHDLKGALRAARLVFKGRSSELIEPDVGNPWPAVEAHEIAGLASLELKRYDEAARHLIAADFGSPRVHELLTHPPPPLRAALRRVSPASKR
jgi:tetratricopeptide (TPR) repeat protein